jgi:poly-gamma-glutamate capsule biosynthesis protein CapA/YwtB (metallophosphatase superfamily)
MCNHWTLSLVGDLALARGLDQVLRYPGSPQLYEGFVTDAREYVLLAWKRLKKKNPNLLAGDSIFVQMNSIFTQPRDLWISNLETSLTTSSRPWPHGINYKTNPKNVYFLLDLQQRIKCPLLLCLANNHVLDWQYEGLVQTLNTLRQHNLAFIGAGRNLDEASQPFVLRKQNSRCIVFATCHPSAGVPLDWAATRSRAGVFLIPDLGLFVPVFTALCQKFCQPGDLKVLMIHWGGNWQDKIDPLFQKCCHDLVDRVGFHVLCNTSAHHVMPIETYHDAIICYSPGDFLNDYYGIEDPFHQSFQPDVGEVISVSFDCNHIQQIKKDRIQRIGFQLQPLISFTK